MYAGDDQRYGGYGSQGNRGGSGGYGDSGYGEGGYESRRGGVGGGYGGRGGDRRSSGYDRRDEGGRGGGGDRESYGGGGGRGFGGGQRGGDCRSGFDGGNYGGTQEHDMPDTIFITGMPEDVTEEQIEEHFGAIGIIKTDKKTRKKKIWVYKDKESGRGKGEATVTYDDPPTASSAIAWFDNKEFMGQTIKVQVAQRKSTWVPPQKGGGRGRGRGGGGGGGGFRGGEDRGGRDGDWPCDSCGNKNFSWRNSCNRCDAPKPGGGGGGGGGKDRGDRGGGGGYNRHRPY